MENVPNVCKTAFDVWMEDKFNEVITKEQLFYARKSSDPPVISLPHCKETMEAIKNTVTNARDRRGIQGDQQNIYFILSPLVTKSPEDLVLKVAEGLKVRKRSRNFTIKESLHKTLKNGPTIVLVYFDLPSPKDEKANEKAQGAYRMILEWARKPDFRVGLIVTIDNQTTQQPRVAQAGTYATIVPLVKLPRERSSESGSGSPPIIANPANVSPDDAAALVATAREEPFLTGTSNEPLTLPGVQQSGTEATIVALMQPPRETSSEGGSGIPPIIVEPPNVSSADAADFEKVIAMEEAFFKGTSNEPPTLRLRCSWDTVEAICSDHQNAFFALSESDTIESLRLTILLDYRLKVTRFLMSFRERLEMHLKERHTGIVLVYFEPDLFDEEAQAAFRLICSWAQNRAFRVGLIVASNGPTNGDIPRIIAKILDNGGQGSFDSVGKNVALAKEQKWPQLPMTSLVIESRVDDDSLDTDLIKKEGQDTQSSDSDEEGKNQGTVMSFLHPLTPEEQQIVNNAMYGEGPAGEILSQVGTDSVQRQSMHRLQPGQWLNDEAIHYFYVVLATRDEEMCRLDPSRKRNHFFKSFFMTKLLNEGNADASKEGQYEYRHVKWWSKKVLGKDIFELDKIFFPINQGRMHWMCAVIYIKEKRIQMYDSMGSSGMHYLKSLFQYLQDEHMDKKGALLPDIDQWKLVGCQPGTPSQRNGFDCGVFTCMFADFLSRDWPLVFTQEDITQCRERIALSLMQGSAII